MKTHPFSHQAVLLLGSNLGDRAGFLQKAIGDLHTCGRVVQASAVYESAAWGETDQCSYLNQAVVLATELSPEALLRGCQQLEQAHGRERSTRWAARTLDIDILFYDTAVICLPHLKIPHPLLGERRFVLAPLAQILPQFRHPQTGFSIEALLRRCPDTGWVRRVDRAAD